VGEAVLIRAVLALALASPLVACSSDVCAVPSKAVATGPIAELTPAAVAELIAHEPAATIVDVNPRDIYGKGHLPGAIWMSSSELRLADLPKDRDAKVVFYCYNEICSASHQAASTAVANGWKNVARMPAGIRGWEAAGLEVER
jgi:rhodanese-related sulfurtransferase